MAVLKLYGGATYNLAGVNNNTDNMVATIKNTIYNTKCGDYEWGKETKLLANFNQHLSGSDFGGDFGYIKRFAVYKTMGEKPTLHKVCVTDNSAQRIIEDFTVGDLCDYQYHIHAICHNPIDINGLTVDMEAIVPILSDTIQLHTGTISVIGLKETSDNLYEIDEDNVWLIRYNTENNGYTLNTDKTFHQTQHISGKETAGNRAQRSVPISGLLGKVDCSTGEYTDTYDYIIDWERFAASSTPKMLVDLRGIVSIGDIDTNPQFVYQDTYNHEAAVSFTFMQTNSIDASDVLGRAIPFNPIYYMYLAEALLKENGKNRDNTGTNAWLGVPRREAVE